MSIHKWEVGLPLRGIVTTYDVSFEKFGDWPHDLADTLLRPVIRVVGAELVRGQLVIPVAYGCTHPKLSNLGERGEWVCVTSGCPHYVTNAHWTEEKL
jgi:hypothetical protein